MTRQDWIIVGAGWLALAAIIVGLMLDQRRIERRLRRHRLDLSQHAKRLLQIESAQRGLATSTRAPMPTVGRGGVIQAADAPRVSEDEHHDVFAPSHTMRATLATGNVRAPDPDTTLRLRPPSLGDVHAVIAKTTPRPITNREIARRTQLDLEEVKRQIRALYVDHVIDVAQGHDTERGWVLADPTVRMTHSVLPGAVAR